MIETGMVEINIEIERNWTWVYGSTYPIKEELKAQGFYWSAKRRAWYNRSIVEVNLNNGNGHDTAKEELSEHDKALLEGNYKIEGKPSEEKEAKKITELERLKEDLEGTKQARDRWGEVLKKHPNGFEARQAIKKLNEEIRDYETKINEHEEKEAWRTEEYEKTVNELKERFGILNPM